MEFWTRGGSVDLSRYLKWTPSMASYHSLVIDLRLWKMMEFGPVGMMTFPYMKWKNKIHVPNHQPVILCIIMNHSTFITSYLGEDVFDRWAQFEWPANRWCALFWTHGPVVVIEHLTASIFHLNRSVWTAYNLYATNIIARYAWNMFETVAPTNWG